MSNGVGVKIETVAGGRLATSAQPPRATPILDSQVSSELTQHPICSFLPLDDPGALRVGLHCLTASRPLPIHTLLGGKPRQPFSSNSTITHFRQDQAFK
jgi:hypothetical protein